MLKCGSEILGSETYPVGEFVEYGSFGVLECVVGLVPAGEQ